MKKELILTVVIGILAMSQLGHTKDLSKIPDYTNNNLGVTESDERGTGVTAGGQIDNGKLRELANRRARPSCTKGLAFNKSLPTFTEIIKILNAGNRAFGYDFEKKANEATVCMSTSKLNKDIITRNQNGVFVSSREYDQVAIWVVNSAGTKVEIYIDENLYKTMDEVNKSFLMLHEIMHSFLINDPSATYINRMWYFIEDIYVYYENDKLPSAKDLKAMFQMYNVRYPSIKNRFHKAISSSEPELLDLSDQLFSQVHSKNRQEVLKRALLFSDPSVAGIDKLIQLGVDINTIKVLNDDHYSVGILSDVLIEKNIEIFKFVIDKGADIHLETFFKSFGIDVEDENKSFLQRILLSRYGESKSKFHLDALEYLIQTKTLDKQKTLADKAYKKIMSIKKRNLDQIDKGQIRLLNEYLGVRKQKKKIDTWENTNSERGK